MSGITELVDAMRTRGIIAADAPPAPDLGDERPWFLALLLSFAGWFAGVFVLVFLGLMLDLESTGAILAVGLVLLGVAWALYFADRDAVFLDQLALAFSIAGQFAVAWAILKDVNSALAISATLFGLQCLVFLMMPNKVARTIAAFFACIAWAYVVRFALRPGQGGDLFFDADGHAKIPMFGAWTIPVEWLLTWLPLIAALVWLLRTESQWMARGARAFARPAITGLLLGLALGGIAAEPVTMLAFGIEALGMRFSWYALFPLLSIALAMFAAYCAFQLRSYGLLGLGVVAALAHLARFYYLYGTTLLWKSAIMLIVGGVLLAAAVILQKHAARAAA
jgi:hypothetical protein